MFWSPLRHLLQCYGEGTEARGHENKKSDYFAVHLSSSAINAFESIRLVLNLIVLTLDRQSSCLSLSVVVPHRITESTSSCGSAGTTRGWSYRRTSSPILSPLIPRCSNVSGNLTCSSPTRRAPTFTTSPKRIFSSSSSVMETSSSVWGNEFYPYIFFQCLLC